LNDEKRDASRKDWEDVDEEGEEKEQYGAWKRTISKLTAANAMKGLKYSRTMRDWCQDLVEAWKVKCHVKGLNHEGVTVINTVLLYSGV